MNNVNWTSNDFNVFEIDGLEQRMDALSTIVRPKFQILAEKFSNYFSVNTGEEFFPHIAKHARRTINPPKDSWVAFAPYKRGYKSLPHFQIGLWNTHLFIIVAIIYEAPQKSQMATRLLENIHIFNELPEDFIISGDHMSQDAILLKTGREKQLEPLLVRLRDVKKGEFLVGRHISRDEAINLSSDQFLQLTEETFEALLPIYNIITGK
ncbi:MULTISPECIES: YktB family protein [Lysinibacillus]|uniref:UPF0637 protein EK386_11240 n=1 Tax=Lysinibacillus antri TaxID=2498145 RepID=A0A3S0RIZ0_9BACI|nr:MULTISPECIES: DUF1054 domain-containing protein [Lysinibacillus]RUL51909.1 DUF1054 domain-containing protein [Lysinibacillus antri]TSI09287.1 DUF1054 domain-containing protein [Lysinibacillus sp. BW-2-10]